MHARLLIAIIVGACGGGGSAHDVDATSTPDSPVDTPTSTAVPRVEPAACKFQVATSLGLTEGTGYSCGYLIVYENRANPSRTIKLHYIQFHATNQTGRATIYLDGGPGGDGEGIVSYANFLGAPFLNGLMGDGDFLVIGQRGTALSLPYLDCQADDCSDYAAMADIPSYNTAYNADDVDDLRAALGYDKLNLYGISYGSRLGLEVLRRHGDKVRAALIEGLVPSQVVWPAAVPASFYSALTNLNASCAATGACGSTYGNLVTKFTTGLAALDANPVTVSTAQGDFQMDGNTYASLLHRFFYSRSTFRYLPLMISDLAVRRTDRIGNLLSSFGGGGGGAGISTGLYYSVVCGELFNPPDDAAFETANSGVPQSIKDRFGGSWFGMVQFCPSFPRGNLQAQLQQPVTSSVRTFVSSGKLDPITPPSFGTIAAQNLSNSFHVIHADSGHGATLQSPCGQQNLYAFIADPNTPHDTSCAASITTDYVIPAAFAPSQIPTAQIRAELGLVPRFPQFPK